MARKKLLILHSGKPDTRKIQLKPAAEVLYDVWWHVAKRFDTDLYRASIYDFTGVRFNKVWQRKSSGWRLLRSSFKPTVVYDRTRLFDKNEDTFDLDIFWRRELISDALPLINHPYLVRLLSNQAFIPSVFREATPEVVFREPREIVLNPKRKPIVLKKLYDVGKDAVNITTRKKVLLNDYVVQQSFVNTKQDGRVRDTRVVFVNGEPVHAYHQLAMPGKFSTSINSGAQTEFVPLGSLKSLISFAKNIAQPLAVFPKRVFSLNIMTDARTGRHYLVDASPSPNLLFLDTKQMERFLTRLTRVLLTE